MSSKDPFLDALLAAGTRETKSITLSTGVEVPIRGLTILEVCRIAARFPTYKKRFFAAFGIGGGEREPVGSILIDAVPDLAGAIVAVATDRPNDKRFELAIAALGDVDVLDLLVAVKHATMPEGLAPFFVRFVPTAIRTGLLTEQQAMSLIADLEKTVSDATMALTMEDGESPLPPTDAPVA